MSVVTEAQVRALVKTALSSVQLQDVIDREEAMLAAEVGPLTGSRVDEFTITDLTVSRPVRIRRPTTSVSVTEANTTTADIRLGQDGRTVYRLSSTGYHIYPWAGVVEVTSTPSDLAKVTSWVIELVRARLARTGYLDEDNPERLDYDAVFAAAVDDILGRSARKPSRGLRSVRMSTDLPSPSWIGSVRP